MICFKLYLVAVALSLMSIHVWAYRDIPNNKPLHIYWENSSISNRRLLENGLPQVVKTAFYYNYGYYYKLPGSPYYIYQPYTRAVRAPTGVYYVPAAKVRHVP